MLFLFIYIYILAHKALYNIYIYIYRDVGDDDLLKVEKKKDKNKKEDKSLEQLLQETDNMFKDIQDKQDDVPTDLNMNVDDNFNFDDYINSQNVDND